MHSGLKWFARFSGIIVTIFFFAFFKGEGIFDLSKSKEDHIMYFVPFCIPAFIGFVMAWFKPYMGGIIMIIGSLLMGSYFVYYADFRMAMVFGIPALLIGLSFIASVHKELL